MRKVEYINELGKSISFGDSLPYFLKSIDGSSLGITEQIYKSIGQDGQKAGEITLNARTILCEFIFSFVGSVESYRRQWQNICEVFSPKLKGTLHYSNDGGSYKIDCRPYEVPAPLKDSQFTVQFIADSPLWKAEKRFYQKLGTVKGGLSFPFSFNPKIRFGTWEKECTIYNDTSIETPFIINIESVSDYCQITNQKGEFIRIDKPIGLGERLEIDTGNYTVKLYSNDNSFVYANNKITLDSTYFKLYAGENILTLDNGTETLSTASIAYNSLFLGV